MAREFIGPRIAWLAALFQASFPLELIYSTHLFPDVVVALFSTSSLWFWLRALRDDRTRDFLLCGLFLVLSYLCRETVVMDGPIYLALWAFYGRIFRPRVLWASLAPLLVIAIECGIYAATTGSATYRWTAILSQQRDPGNLALIGQSFSGGGFWTDPLMMVAANQEFGLYHVAAMVIAVAAFRRRSPARPFAIWLIVGFLWTFYGTTVPMRWVTLQRDPRYAAALTAPSVILIAYGLDAFPPKVRGLLAGIMIVTGLLAASLDQGRSVLSPHSKLLRVESLSECAFEPFEYVGALCVRGFKEHSLFTYATDCGRPSVTRLLSGIRGTVPRPISKARFFVISPGRRPGLLERLQAEGWTIERTIDGEATMTRVLVARLLQFVPSQKARASRILHPAGLVVLENPAFRRVDKPEGG